MLTLRRRPQSGQTIVLLALLLGILMVIVSLVIDVGSTHRVRAETHYVCDAASLAGMAEWTATHDSDLARARALDICARNGYVVGQNGVDLIRAWGYNHLSYNETAEVPKDPSDTDRYYVQIHRELPQYIANIIGIGRTGVLLRAVAALLGTVPIDASIYGGIGFPDKANLAQFGPDAPFTFGDPYSTKKLDNGSDNPYYNPSGYRYDLFIPDDYESSPGHQMVRIEIFDPDTINRGNHVSTQPSRLQSTDGDPSEPEVGGIDEIRAPPPNGNAGTSPAQFPTRSTQIDFRVVDNLGNIVLTATYGPNSNTPFYLQPEDPAGGAPHTAVDSGDGRAQIATDLHWVTPQGFQFDAAAFQQPLRLMVQTVSGSSEDGYGLRMGKPRSAGQTFDPVRDAVAGSSALAIYGAGKLPINFSATDVTRMPIGEVPSNAEAVIVTNFDTDVGSQFSHLSITSFDSTTGQGDYPVLWPAPSSASGEFVVTDPSGNKYYTVMNGGLSGNGQFHSDTLDIPPNVVVPRTDGNGNLLLDGSGNIEVVDTRAFEGGTLGVSYSAGQSDTSIWEVSFDTNGLPGSQHIVLIR